MQANLILDCQNHHGEGIQWNADDRRIWWTDIEGRCIWSFDPVSGKSRQYPTTDRVCCFAPRQAGGLIVAFADRISLLDLNTGREQAFYQFEPENPNTRLNDGRTDRQGRLIVGGMNEGSGAADSSVLRVEHDLTVSLLFKGVSCANSTCFSSDGKTMFFADTPERQLVAYDYDTQLGQVSNRRVYCSFANEPGLPDGSCVDAEGGLFAVKPGVRGVIDEPFRG